MILVGFNLPFPKLGYSDFTHTYSFSVGAGTMTIVGWGNYGSRDC